MYAANYIINAIIANTTITDTTTAAISPVDVSSDGSIVAFSNESKKACNTSAEVKFNAASDLNSKGITTKEYNKKGIQ